MRFFSAFGSLTHIVYPLACDSNTEQGDKDMNINEIARRNDGNYVTEV